MEALQHNGQIVSGAMATVGPASLPEIVNYVSTLSVDDRSAIQSSVKQILRKGLAYGFVQKIDNKYSLSGQPPSNFLPAINQAAAGGHHPRRMSPARKSRKVSPAVSEPDARSGPTKVATPTKRKRTRSASAASKRRSKSQPKKKMSPKKKPASRRKPSRKASKTSRTKSPATD